MFNIGEMETMEVSDKRCEMVAGNLQGADGSPPCGSLRENQCLPSFRPAYIKILVKCKRQADFDWPAA
jgi:hypothetical protein